ARHRTNEFGRQGERQKTMSDRRAARQLALCTLDVNVDPLVVAGRVGKAFDLFLGDLQPVADTDFSADRCFEFIEVIENAHATPLSVDIGRFRSVWPSAASSRSLLRAERRRTDYASGKVGCDCTRV